MSKQDLPRTPNSPVSEPIQRLIGLFAQHLAELRFPGVDATRLESLADEVRTHAERVAWAKAELLAAEQAHAESTANLEHAALRAHGYATVFAADDESLRAELDAIDLSSPRRAPTQRKRRAKKAPPKAEPLARAS